MKIEGHERKEIRRTENEERTKEGGREYTKKTEQRKKEEAEILDEGERVDMQSSQRRHFPTTDMCSQC